MSKTLQELLAADREAKKQSEFAAKLAAAKIRHDEWSLFVKAMPEEAKQIEAEDAKTIQFAVRDFQREAHRVFEGAAISRDSILRIKNTVPMAEWPEAIAKVEAKQTKKPLPKLSLINHEVINRLLQDADEDADDYSEVKCNIGTITIDGNAQMQFAHLAIYSGIYSFINYGYSQIELRDLYLILHPTAQWRHLEDGDRIYFRSLVMDALAAVSQWKFWVGNDTFTGAEFILDADLQNDTIIIHENRHGILDANNDISTRPVLFDLSKPQEGRKSRFLAFPEGIFATRKLKINWLEKIYVARRVSLANHKANKMSATILFETLKSKVGTADRAKVKSYFAYLQSTGIIDSYTASASKITWTPALQTDDARTIAIKDEQGNYIEKEKTEEVKRKEAELQDYNQYLKHQQIKTGDKVLDCSLLASYNRGSWECNGRLYTKQGQQNISKQEREAITINGKATIELDFSCLHVNMLYQANGMELQGDAYDFDSDRTRAKTAILRAIDSKSRNSALYSVTAYLAGVPEGDKATPEQVAKYLPEAEKLLEMAEQRHAAIKEQLYKDQGLHLQNQDAEIMMHIIRELQRRKIVALPVHDSVIVAKEREQEARKVMRTEYKKVMGRTCPIK